MSKSYQNEIRLADDPETIRKKVMPMMTDPARKRRTDPGDPALCPVFDLHKIFTDQEGRDWVTEGCKTAGIGCVDCKKLLLEQMRPRVEPIYERHRELKKHPDTVKDILLDGSRRARVLAEKTMKEVRQAMQVDYS